MPKEKYNYSPVSIQPITEKRISELLEIDSDKYQSKAHVVTLAVKLLHEKETRRIAKLVKQEEG